MGNSRSWLFRGLVIAGASLLLITWFTPWWSCDIDYIKVENGLVIYPYGIENNLGAYATLVPRYLLPRFLPPLLWAYLALGIIALLVAVVVQDKSIGLFGRKYNLSRWLVGIVGFSYIVVVVVAVIYAAIRTGEFGKMHLLGKSFVELEEHQMSYVYARLLFSYWLACTVGPFLTLLAIFRNKIIGKTNMQS